MKFLNSTQAQADEAAAAAEAEEKARLATEAAAQAATKDAQRWRLVISSEIEIIGGESRPNWWHRLWQRLLLGWVWERAGREEEPGAGDTADGD